MRLRYADAVVVLDLPVWRCAWRAAATPQLRRRIALHAPRVELIVVRRRTGIPGLVASSHSSAR